MRLKKINYFFIPLFLITYSASLHAQGFGILKGIVTDASDKEAIVGAHIYDPSDKTHGVATDINGNYQLRLSSGKRTIVCSYISNKSDSIIVLIDSLNPTEHNFD